MKKKMIILSFLILILIFTGTAIFANIHKVHESNLLEKKVDVKAIYMDMIGTNPYKVEIDKLIRQNEKIQADKKQMEYIKEYKEFLASLVPEDEEEADPIEEPEEVSKPGLPLEGKYAYLTFDDGPSKHVTTQILDILDQYNIKATFFVLGYMIDRNPDVLIDIYNRGHVIGNHSYSHKYEYIYYNTKNFMEDLQRGEDTMKNYLGEDFSTDIMRFPGGSHADFKDPMKKAVLEAGYKYYDWNSLNGDSEEGVQSITRMLNRFIQTAGTKEVLIVLMHDTDVKQLTVESLPFIIEFLIDKGYQFNTLDKYNH